MTTSARAQAYGRVVQRIDDLAASKLHPDEQQVIREAADSLLFCEDLSTDPAAGAALKAFHELTDRLMESDRLLPETAGELVADVEACGPLTRVA